MIACTAAWPVAGVVFVIMLGHPNLGMPETSTDAPGAQASQPAGTPSAARLADYAAALQHEQALARVRRQVDDAVQGSIRLRKAARAYSRGRTDLTDKAEVLVVSLTLIGKRNELAMTTGRRAVAAIGRYAEAGARSLSASSELAAAAGPRRAALAREADAAGRAREAALAAASQAVRGATVAAESLRTTLQEGVAEVGYFAEQVVRLREAADVLAQSAAALQDDLRRIATEPRLIDSLPARAAEAHRMARSIRAETIALKPQLRLISDDAFVRLSNLRKPRAMPLGAYFDAVVRVSVEREARAYLQSVRTFNPQACAAGTPCEAALTGEVAVVDDLLTSARQDAEVRLKALGAADTETAGITNVAYKLAAAATADAARLTAGRAMAATLHSHTVGLVDAARAAYRRAEAAYRTARLAADAAYLAAFGEPRQLAKANGDGGMGDDEPVGARAPAFVPGAVERGAIRIESHAWEFFNITDAEPVGYGAYTYLLFGHRVGARLSDTVLNRYVAALDTVIATTPHRLEIDTNVPRERLNLFCIPGYEKWFREVDDLFTRRDTRAALDNYNSSLAYSRLAVAGNGVVRSSEILSQIKYSPGPFLLTAVQPLPNITSNSPLLFVDLSQFHPDAFAEIVAEYKQALIESPPRAQEIWEPETFKWVAIKALDVAEHIRKTREAIGIWFAGKTARAAVR